MDFHMFQIIVKRLDVTENYYLRKTFIFINTFEKFMGNSEEKYLLKMPTRNEANSENANN